ncbi:phytoene desaturase family protein [Paenibacillus mucilaginosus]|uniref:Amine oxidase domain-containing protein n=1 Tax=Paenibacillus mucilaginosus (strain KNP414) TaxID=1036673 RepID=F8F983_PAEMK|nr:NAD(P)/FAD-dependent oxidoreductase [Paenibacillus mucilaginosus]AEI43011.1 conserved hypothetical protein [Paenibacillus mucilaginosus KNP414]MCG7216123.1 NAD(P)/FAD-dependent oxidoreductase [Paenibacillus mucilaginosus]WDM24638.1 NAD(P)/FAD-dependent oxidoreductase [Paenibacillus mucilaginosus]
MQDVIIIGSGLGGLVTGAYLSKEGSSNVTVLERHYVHGGFATSFRRRPWEFDVSLHCLSGLAQGGRVGQIFEELGMFGRVEFHRAENLYRAVFPEHDLSVSGDPGAYRETLHRLFPQEREAIDGFFHACAEIREEMIHTHSRKPSTIIAYKDDSLQQMMDRFTMSKELQCMLAQFWVYFGLQPSELSAVYFAYAWTDYHHFGGYYPQGRSQRISDALKAIIEENGGRVITREDVEEITAPGGRVNGVRTKRGHEYSADLVISNIHPGQTLSRLSDPGSVPAAYREKVRRLRPSYSCLQAYLIMRGSLSEEYGEHHHEIFLNPTYDLNTIGEAIRTEQYEAMPLCITAYENIAPGYQPQPVTTLTVMQLCEAEGWTGLDDAAYQAKKEEILALYLRRLESLYPGISGRMEHMELATPRTVIRYTNHPQGAIYGAAPTVEQALSKGLSQTTPIEGLYLVGAWSRPGAGYSGVISGGHNLAKQLMGVRV